MFRNIAYHLVLETQNQSICHSLCFFCLYSFSKLLLFSSLTRIFIFSFPQYPTLSLPPHPISSTSILPKFQFRPYQSKCREDILASVMKKDVIKINWSQWILKSLGERVWKKIQNLRFQISKGFLLPSSHCSLILPPSSLQPLSIVFSREYKKTEGRTGVVTILY